LIEVDGNEGQIELETEEIKATCNELKAIDVRIVTDEKECATYWYARSRLYSITTTLFKRVITEDITVPRNRFPEVVRAIQSISLSVGIGIGLAGHAGDGNIHPTILMGEISEEVSRKADKAIEELIKVCLELQGTISGEHGIGIHKSSFLELEHGAKQVEIMKSIKKTLDPLGIMNPGKIWNWKDGGNA